MIPALAHSVLQLVALAALVAGLYLLAGLPWALVVGGGVVGAASVLAELGRPHPAVARTRDGSE